MLALTSKHRTDFNAFDGRSFNFSNNVLRDFLTGFHDATTGGGIDDVVNRNTTQNAFSQRRDDFIAILQG